MRWSHSKPGGSGESGGDETDQQVGELIDRYHSRASIDDGDRILIDAGKVLENIAFAMERVDTDITTPVSIEDDVVSFAELTGLIQTLGMGPSVAVHVVNTAMRIMSARYPDELVRLPLPDEFDLRAIQPAVQLADREHDVAKAIFNQRTASEVDLDADDVAAAVEPLDLGGQIRVFIALFFMFGTKVGAMKYRTGIE
ncbi:hypothetical protein [Krasilnikovia sp. M28-CT-15]|uniref:hypothetical protein n=1 Tax=Krasilnikovia sp. M28-CT-15 TaxID=3373540 RepID=UPI0038762BBF